MPGHLALLGDSIFANRAYVLQTGQVVKEGPAAQLLQDPEVKKAYLGG